MTSILLTGFGPFPGAPFNPTGPLVEVLAARRYPGIGEARLSAHVFTTAYEAVDRDLPPLMASLRPDIVLMFGLAQRSRHLRIEARARNSVTSVVPDARGCVPLSSAITPGAAESLPLSNPAHRLAMAARAAGVPAVVSHDAGRYLCNYLCWRVCETAARDKVPRLFAFVHVPRVARMTSPKGRLPRRPYVFEDLVRAGEAIALAAVRAARAWH
jgi:pyroglutamyl-peptidase